MTITHDALGHLVFITVDLFKLIYLMTYPFPPLPPVLTPNGGHQNTYGLQAGGTHPTRTVVIKFHSKTLPAIIRNQV